MLRIENVVKKFVVGSVEKTALNGVSLHLRPGEFVTVIGSNGAGKSTLLNAVAGAYPVEKGSIFIGSEEITRRPEHVRAIHIGRVFQDPATGTAANMTIEENLSLALSKTSRRNLRRGITQKHRQLFRERLKLLGLGLEDRLTDKVGLLSGGQRQALALLMATLCEPKVLLLDEHTAALDPKTAVQINELTREIVRRSQLTTLMVTHNLEYALRFGTRTIMMHEGRIILDLSGPKREIARVQDLLDYFNRVRGETFAVDRALLA